MEIEVHRAKEGLKTAVAEVFSSSDSPESEQAEQLAFLPDLPLDSGLPDQARAGVQRGRGRPAGAKNKNTEAWREYLLKRGRSPLEVLMQTYSMSPAALGKALGLKNDPTFDQSLELFKLQISAAKELAPYIHQKMPIALDAGEGGLIQLVINQGQVTNQAGADAIPQAIKILNSKDEENQLVSDADFTESNELESNENG